MSIEFDAGTYQVEVVDLGMDFDSDSKHPVIKVRGRILARLNPDGSEPVERQSERTVWLNCSPKAKRYVLLKLRHAGWRGSDFNKLREQLLAQHVRFVNAPQIALSGKYEGQLCEKWDMELPPAEKLEANPKVAGKLNELFGNELKDLPDFDNPPTKAELAKLPETDSDVPF